MVGDLEGNALVAGGQRIGLVRLYSSASAQAQEDRATEKAI